mmetsp:Transcript_11150/g.29685  ORF Transcript_11150/g.29685 Transcript_11150/m.29685 type:complete len:247 (+) Transcript_11150:336-1076(+)
MHPEIDRRDTRAIWQSTEVDRVHVVLIRTIHEQGIRELPQAVIELLSDRIPPVVAQVFAFAVHHLGAQRQRQRYGLDFVVQPHQTIRSRQDAHVVVGPSRVVLVETRRVEVGEEGGVVQAASWYWPHRHGAPEVMFEAVLDALFEALLEAPCHWAAHVEAFHDLLVDASGSSPVAAEPALYWDLRFAAPHLGDEGLRFRSEPRHRDLSAFGDRAGMEFRCGRQYEEHRCGVCRPQIVTDCCITVRT